MSNPIRFLRTSATGLLLAIGVAAPVSAHTADEIISKFIKTVGGAEKITAVTSLRKTGKFTGGGGFEAVVVEENRRPNKVRQEFQFQGMVGITAYDGGRGWKIEPWQGKKDPEPLGEDELKAIVEDADFDGPLMNYKQKGNKVEYLGLDPVEGTDAFKLKVTLANGDVRHYYMDTDYYVPIKIETKRMIRGSEREFETVLGDYKEVSGWYLPHSIESGLKGGNLQKVTFERIEANVSLPDNRFAFPGSIPKDQPERVPDASETQPKKESETPPADPGKPPVTEGEVR